MSEVQKLLEAFQQADATIKSLVEKQDAEIKALGKSTEETAAKLAEVTKQWEQLQHEAKGIDERVEEIEKKAGRMFGGGQEVKSPGERFIESEQFQRAVKAGTFNVEPVNIGSYLGVKAIGSASASAGAALNQFRVPGLFYDPGQRPQFLRDIMNVGSTTESSVEFVRELVYTNSAGPQWDSATERADFGTKPQSNITFELINRPVRTLGHWLPASRQIFADVGMMQSHVSSRMRYGLALEEDKQILYGTNTGGDLEGLMVASGVQNIGERAVGDNFLDHIRRAIALARVAEYPVTGIVLHPTDWAAIELTKGSGDGQYVWAAAPATGGGPTMWRVPVVETTAINEGDFLVGNFALGTQLWDREATTVRISESHNDLFIKNAVAVLVEERVCQTIYRPKAFVKGVFDLVST